VRAKKNPSWPKFPKFFRKLFSDKFVGVPGNPFRVRKEKFGALGIRLNFSLENFGIPFRGGGVRIVC
jgi:hypothetical protein